MVQLAEDRAFVDAWNALDRAQRSYIRRLVRVGRPIEDPRLASVADAYARYQASRPWMRWFWLWFLPGLVVALGIAAQIHPIFVGVAIALGAQAVFTRYNLRKRERRHALNTA